VPQNSFTFVDVYDLHSVFDDFGYSMSGVLRGHKQLFSTLRYIEEIVDFKKFDQVILFSDHGHYIPNYDMYNEKDGYNNDLRSKIFLQIFNPRNNKYMQHDNKFHTLMDLSNYVLKLYNNINSSSINQVSFNLSISSELLIEDYISIKSNLNYLPNLWNFKCLEMDNIFYISDNHKNLENYYSTEIKKTLDKKYPHLRAIIDENIGIYEFNSFLRQNILTEGILTTKYMDGTYKPKHFYRKMSKYVPVKFKQHYFFRKILRLVNKIFFGL
jgi:hypothetical protein